MTSTLGIGTLLKHYTKRFFSFNLGTAHLLDGGVGPVGGGGGTLGLFGWGSSAGTLEPLANTRASSSEFCYPILD